MSYLVRRHPVATFLAALVFGPYLLAAALLFLVLYALGALFLLAFGRKG